MDLLRLAVLQIAASFHPKDVEELHRLADEMMAWIRRDLPVADDETAIEGEDAATVEIIFTADERREH